MLNGSLLFGFVIAALIVLIILGPGVLYVVARSVGQGYRAGFVSALGLSIGVFAHVGAAAVGLSAILLTSATAFGIVKLLGAVYLIYLGVRTILSARMSSDLEVLTPLPLRRLFYDGILVSIFNPKIAIFFLAFLPQFVDATIGLIPLQILLLGLIYSALALLTDSAYAVFAGALRQQVGGKLLRGPLLQYLSGTLLFGLGVKAALSVQRQ